MGIVIDVVLFSSISAFVAGIVIVVAKFLTEMLAEMPRDVSGWLDTVLLAGLASLIGVFVFVSAIEGWRLWSERRRLRKHFRH